jgi:hypothetical protein
MDLTTMSVEELESRRAELEASLREIAALDDPTDEQLEQGESLAADIDATQAAIDEKQTAAQSRADRAAALRSRFAEEGDADGGDEGQADEASEADGDQPEETPEAETSGADAPDNGSTEQASTKPKQRVVAALARKTPRPAAPVGETFSGITITAAADVPDVPSGAKFAGLTEVGLAAQRKLSMFAAPQGTGEVEDLRKYPLAKLQLDYGKDVLDERTASVDEVLDRVANESTLESDQGSGSLVAAGGWCAPSETLYDLCGEEVVTGLVSIPEVAVKRGGLRYTEGTDFSTIYSAIGFAQTEAQAIAGTTKPCYEIPCPTFSETRLDVIGLCIKIPILTEVGYPEQVKDVTAKALIAHQYKVNADTIGRMLAAAPAAVVATGLGSVMQDSLEIFEQIAVRKRQQYRLGDNKTLEVVLPMHAKAMFRNDMERRNGISLSDVATDNLVAARFRARNLNVQYVYGWQELPLVDVGGTATVREDIAWPTTFDALIYPAGTYTRGTADVINLSAVYDAASLATNTYTGLFMEEGTMVFRRCYQPVRVTIPVCTAGRTGAANFTCP